jgi:hypothetical protein
MAGDERRQFRIGAANQPGRAQVAQGAGAGGKFSQGGTASKLAGARGEGERAPLTHHPQRFDIVVDITYLRARQSHYSWPFEPLCDS